MNLLVLLSLFIVLWSNFYVVSNSIFNEFAKLILFFFYFVNQIFRIFNDKARFLNFFLE